MKEVKTRQKAIIDQTIQIFCSKKGKTEMKNFLKTSLTFLLTFAILLSGTFVAFAEDETREIMPRLNVALNSSSTFTIANTNKATVSVRYVADSSIFQKATVTVKIEKRFLLVFNNHTTVRSLDEKIVAMYSSVVEGRYNESMEYSATALSLCRDLIDETHPIFTNLF